jgi:hypothetical protein
MTPRVAIADEFPALGAARISYVYYYYFPARAETD